MIFSLVFILSIAIRHAQVQHGWVFSVTSEEEPHREMPSGLTDLSLELAKMRRVVDQIQRYVDGKQIINRTGVPFTKINQSEEPPVETSADMFYNERDGYGRQGLGDVVLNVEAVNHEGSLSRDVILYAKQRSGSTFASSFFVQHQEFFYIFEPLNQLTLEGILKEGADLLRRVLSCDFSRIRDFGRAGRKSWIRHVFCQLTKQTRTCGKDFKVDSEDCSAKPRQMTKIITLRRVKYLESLVRDGVKVVMLVRDPRGVISSRNVLGRDVPKWEGDTYDQADVYCQDWLTDLAYMRARRQKDPEGTDSSFYFVRYEDLASKPMEQMERLYNFLGVTPDESLRTYVQSLQIKATGVASHVEQTELRHNVSQSAIKYKTLSAVAKDNSTSRSQHWRDDLILSQVRAIQAACKSYMTEFGYVPVKTAAQLADKNRMLLTSYDQQRLLVPRG